MPDGQQTLRIAVVGAGHIGRRHALCWSRLPGAAVTAIVDAHPERARALAETLGNPQIAVAADAAVLAQAPDAVDAVSLCVPTIRHREVAEPLLHAGIPVLCEKPMALNTGDCDAMIAAAEQGNALLSVAQVVRFFPEVANARRLVEAGAVGAPATVRTRRGGDFPKAVNDWYADVDQSGGVLFDLVIHDIDWTQWCFGPIVRVYAQGLTERLARREVDHLDYALLTCRHAGGVISHLEGTWADPSGFATTFEIAGDGGLLAHDSRAAAPLRQSVRASAEVVAASPERRPAAATSAIFNPLAPVDDPYYAQIAAFAAAVRGTAPVAVSAADARHAVAVAVAARESLRTGRAVEIAGA